MFESDKVILAAHLFWGYFYKQEVEDLDTDKQVLLFKYVFFSQFAAKRVQLNWVRSGLLRT